MAAQCALGKKPTNGNGANLGLEAKVRPAADMRGYAQASNATTSHRHTPTHFPSLPVLFRNNVPE